MLARSIMALRIVAVLAVAFAAGHVVQTLRPLPQETAAASAIDAPQPVLAELPQLAGIVAVSATTTGDDPACALGLRLENAPGAMIDLSLSAPCNMGERVVFRHAGLAFTETIGADGQVQVQLPAMTADALVAAYVGSSEVVLGKISVPDMAEYLRLAVQIAGSARFDLRADEQGQVFVAKSAGLEGAPHRITTLGQARMEDPLLSQVYSVALRDFASPELTVELGITPETCGRTLAAEVVVSRFGKALRSSRSVAVPLCGTSGDILLLKNLLPDLTLDAPE